MTAYWPGTWCVGSEGVLRWRPIRAGRRVARPAPRSQSRPGWPSRRGRRPPNPPRTASSSQVRHSSGAPSRSALPSFGPAPRDAHARAAGAARADGGHRPAGPPSPPASSRSKPTMARVHGQFAPGPAAASPASALSIVLRCYRKTMGFGGLPITKTCWRCGPGCVASCVGASNRQKSPGLTPAQHQLLLAIRGHPGPPVGPTVGEVADYLLLRHHSAVGLVDRAVAGQAHQSGFRDPEDHRVVRLHLTAAGSKRLEGLS